MGGGAWPFLVGGVICLVDSDNERDLNLLNSYANPSDYAVKEEVRCRFPGLGLVPLLGVGRFHWICR